MKKNKLLLSESDTRRFMKLASVGALTESFVDTMEEQEEEELMGPDPEPEAAEDPMGLDDPELEDEEGLEGAGEPAMDEEFVEELVTAIAGTIEDVTGVPVNVTGEDEGEVEDVEGDLGDLGDLEDLEGEEELAGLEGEEEEEEGLEALAEHIARSLFTTAPDPEPAGEKDDLVERLSAQVAARLLNNS